MTSMETKALLSQSPAEARRATLVLRLSAAAVVLAITVPLAFIQCTGTRMLGLVGVNLAYMLASLATYWVETRSGGTQESVLGVVIDASALTAVLFMVCGLWTPLVALYLPAIALASLAAGPRRGAIAALAAIGTYSLAQLVAASGLAIPSAMPEFLNSHSPLAHVIETLSVAFVLGVGYLMSMVAERRLRTANSDRIASVERARHFYESSPSLFIELDRDGRILFASPNHERILGYSSSKLVGQPAASLASLLEAHIETHENDGVADPLVTVRTREGRRLFFEVTLARERETSGELRLIAVSRDVTARSLAHEALRASEQRFRAVAEMTSDLLVEIDEAQRVVWRGPSFERVMGAPQERFGDQIALSMVHPEDRELMEHKLEATRTQDIVGPVLVRVGQGEAQQRWHEGYAKSIEVASGERHVLLVGRDVTAARENEESERRHREQLEGQVAARTAELEQTSQALRELQSRLLHAERVGVEGDLAGRIAHAINTPLQVLLGSIQMRIEETHPPDPGDERLLNLVRRIAKIIEDMLNLSRRRELSIQRVRPESLLRSIAQELAQRFGDESPELCVRVAPQTPDLWADENLLRIALEAVIENAIEASPRTSEIWLETAGVARSRGVEFRILDRGLGIADDVAPHVFEPFFSTKRSGTGLGLAIAAGAIAGHGGRIRTEARPGGGTCVRIEISVHRSRSESAKGSPESES